MENTCDNCETCKPTCTMHEEATTETQTGGEEMPQTTEAAAE